MQVDNFFFDMAGIFQGQGNAGIQKGQFTQAVLQGTEIKFGHGEGFRRGHKCNFSSGDRLAVLFQRRITNNLKRLDDVAMFKTCQVFLAVTPDL